MPARWRAARSRSRLAMITPASVARGAVKIETGDDYPRLTFSQFGHNVPPLVANEAVPVKALLALAADAVGGNHGHAIGHRMALHRAAPHAAGINIRVIRLRSDR